MAEVFDGRPRVLSDLDKYAAQMGAWQDAYGQIAIPPPLLRLHGEKENE